MTSRTNTRSLLSTRRSCPNSSAMAARRARTRSDVGRYEASGEFASKLLAYVDAGVSRAHKQSQGFSPNSTALRRPPGRATFRRIIGEHKSCSERQEFDVTIQRFIPTSGECSTPCGECEVTPTIAAPQVIPDPPARSPFLSPINRECSRQAALVKKGTADGTPTQNPSTSIGPQRTRTPSRRCAPRSKL